MKPKYWNKGKFYLSNKDKVLKKIIDQFPNQSLQLNNNSFQALINSIIGQQISTKAADSIWSKFEKKCNKRIKPKIILKISSRNLKSVGLSRQKISYLKNIAKAFTSKSFDVAKLKKMSDSDAINYITCLLYTSDAADE